MSEEEETKPETVSEANTVTDTEPSTAPIRVTEKPQDIQPPIATDTEPSLGVCPHCGAKVVPQKIKTPSGGKTYRCPKCGKFGKFITPEEVKVKEAEAEAISPLPPYEVMLTERVRELLVANLPRVFGIPKKEATKTIAAISDTLNPEAASNPWNLHNHVKNFAPNADDRHLESIIKKIYGQLEVEGYVRTGRRRHRPSYGGRRREEGYRPSYARDEDYEDEDYEEPRRRGRSSRMKVVVEGQEIETDFQGYMAHQRWKREEEEHDLRMKRIEAEILKITRETGGSKSDEGEERRRDQEHELRMKRLEAEILKITRETGGSRAPQGQYEEVREFIDGKGNLCDPEKAVSVRIKRVPIGRGDSEVKILRDEFRDLKETVQRKEMAQLREEIQELKKKPEESPEVKALREQLNESRKSIDDLKGTIEAKDKQVLLDKVGGLEKRLSDLAATGTGDWKSDEIRLIKGSISDIKDLLQTYLSSERPLDRAERILTGGPAGATPPSEMAGEAERRGVIQELRKHGLVTRVVERVRG